MHEQVNNNAIGEGKKSHLGRSISQTTELVKKLTETVEACHFVPHWDRECSFLFTGHGFVDLMAGRSGCHIFYKQQAGESMAQEK